MAKISKRVVLKYVPVKDDAGIHGRDIGKAGTGLVIFVDLEKEHDGWVPITGPEADGVGPIWKETEKQGWIKLANTAAVDEKVRRYVLSTAEDGSIISCVRIS